MISELELLHFAMWHARCEIVRHASAESCVLSVRIVSQVYEHMGIPSQPMVVAVKAVNEQWRDLIDQGVDPDEQHEGAHSIHIDHYYEHERPDELTDDKFAGGHIVLIANGRYLVDPSADQLSYPDLGITVVPGVVDMRKQADDFITGSDQPVVYETEDNAWVGYFGFPDDLSYGQSVDWEQCGPGEPLFDRVYEQVVGLVDLVREADALPTYAELPVAMRGAQKWTAPHLRNAIRSGVELGEIEPTRSGIANFLIRMAVPDNVQAEVQQHPDTQRIIRRGLAKQPRRVPRAR